MAAQGTFDKCLNFVLVKAPSKPEHLRWNYFYLNTNVRTFL